MADRRKVKATSVFNQEFSAALREVMRLRGVTQTAAAEAVGLKQPYINEHTSGLRACDTDVIAGVAEAAKVQPSTIVREVLNEMKRVSKLGVAGVPGPGASQHKRRGRAG